MDDRHAQFLITVGELCSAAGLARLEVELRAGDGPGQTARGIPSAGAPEHRGGAADEGPGYPRVIAVDDRLVEVEDIEQCTIFAPRRADDG